MSARTPVELYVRLDLPPLTVRDAVMHVMRAVGEQHEHYKDLSLAIDLNGPGQAQMRIPIEATVENRPGRWECGLHIEAAKSEKFFPTFDGTISVTPNGRNESELWLQGAYEPPGGALGKGLDATVLHGLAEKSLMEFLSWLSGEVRAEVERAERERAEQIRRSHG